MLVRFRCCVHRRSHAVRRYAENEVKPRAEAMDENEQMDPAIIRSLFEQGLMAIETDPELGGAGGSFMSAIIVIEGASDVRYCG